jgi:ketosteroid isomerase-like protein
LPISVEKENPMRPREVVRDWVYALTHADTEALGSLYHDHAVHHPIALDVVEGREAICAMVAGEFASADMACIVENLFEDGEWAILEWSDLLGRRGCLIFHVQDGKILEQRCYWEKAPSV